MAERDTLLTPGRSGFNSPQVLNFRKLSQAEQRHDTSDGWPILQMQP